MQLSHTINQQKLINSCKLYFQLLIGSLSLACGVVFFLMTAQIPSGGPPGVGILLDYLIGITPGISMAIINSVLLIIGYKKLGKQMFVRSMFVVFLSSFFIDGFIYLYEPSAFTDERVLNAIYAGVFLGFGMGIIFKNDSASGGWSILARLIAPSLNLSLGNCLLLLDFVVVSLSMVLFKDIESGMLGILVVFICGRTIDFIVSGASGIKMIHISSEKAEELKQALKQKMQINSSIMHTEMTEQFEKKILIFYIEKSQLLTVQHLIQSYDANAMLIVHNVQKS